MTEERMGQNNNCLPYKSSSYNVHESELWAGQGLSYGTRRFNGKTRSRRLVSVPAPLTEDENVVLSKVKTRRTSDPILPEAKAFENRSNSTGKLFKSPLPQGRRQSLQAFPDELRRRKSLGIETKRSFRILRGIKSFYERGHRNQESEPSSPAHFKRSRSASLGQVLVAMAHHKLRNSESAGSSPVARRSSQKNAPSENGAPSTQEEEMTNESQQPASVESLVRRSASCFNDAGNCSDSDFPRVLFLTHVWFMTSEQLMVLFSQLYEDESTSSDLKKGVFHAISFWMKEYPHMFDSNPTLVTALNELQTKAADDDQVDSSLIDISNRGNFRWTRKDNLSVRPPPGAGRKRRKVSLVFHHLQPEELAIHISYLEFKCFKRLTFEDFHKYAVHGTIKDNAKLERSVFLFNNITYWVQCMVLGQHTPQERAAVITKYIKIAQKLREMRNYNTLMAIVGGLTHTAVARLKKTMSSLTKDTLKALDELVDLLDSRSNYVAYRRDYALKDDAFKIPIIGILMKDIIGLQAALPDRVGDGLINVKKMLTIGSTFEEIMALQRIPFPHEVNKDLVNTLRVSLYLYYTEEEIYALSLKREPRDTKLSTSSAGSPSKVNSMVFAEFTKFTCQLDRDTVKQHVTAMVESVFKAYDHDNDGFISEEEFQNFTDNFPMMDSFSAMDVDRDGRISRSEMCTYFMKASAVRRNDFCQSFTHDFIESTYFHPTFCEECEKLLWGLVKQGWKCKGCGINCHKHCKDRIVQECRPKQSPSAQGAQPSSEKSTNGNQKNGKKNGTREKSSVSSESDVSANGDTITATINVSSSITALDDEAFDSPGELTSIPSSPSTMRRSTSLASADVTTRKLINIGSNKTPPPSRKATSPETGRQSFQQKMRHFIPKRHNSGKSRAMSDAATQTSAGYSSGPATPDGIKVPHVKSFLYPSAPGSPFSLRANRVNGQLPNGRLGSAGEEIDSASESPLIMNQVNNNHVILRVPPINGGENDEISHSLGNLRVSNRTSSPKGSPTTSNRRRMRDVDPIILNDENASGTTGSFTPPPSLISRYSGGRRDSGLSGCSTFTMTSERSVPATPLFLAEYPTGSSSQPSSGKTPASAFKFPSFSYDDVGKCVTPGDKEFSSLREENIRLRDTNVLLQNRLSAAKEYAEKLELKLKQLGVEISKVDEISPKACNKT